MTEQENNEQTNNNQKHTIEVSGELYEAIQQMKQVLNQMTGKEVNSDEEVIGILVSGFIESLMSGQQGDGQSNGQDSQSGGSNIIT
ncbi:hypothetical protein [Candidatus Absconditicoccus praedator]|uniref:hypothetical protein n=1 Tax=Candidatus Absconditicoccus praedator TaxID=2735562 RepID=UPI001E3F458E|nr:hypothetical protein [Candidatus Absconditicoccus praedator]UFX83046.1 hypothetical protein HLG78_02825 [Candidatus Absconditicoccus praedator]